jgi:hypothetical protein
VELLTGVESDLHDFVCRRSRLRLPPSLVSSVKRSE